MECTCTIDRFVMVRKNVARTKKMVRAMTIATQSSHEPVYEDTSLFIILVHIFSDYLYMMMDAMDARIVRFFQILFHPKQCIVSL
jgi:hypothetical protein